MAEKKDRGRYTLRPNEKDPAHAEVIRVLEQQGPHSKGRFIVNAVLHYIHCGETPDITIRQTPDRTVIETIVLEILQQNTKPNTDLLRQSSAMSIRPEEDKGALLFHTTVQTAHKAAFSAVYILHSFLYIRI